MMIKHNWGLLKNQIIGFKEIEDNKISVHKGIMKNVKTFKDKLKFTFEDGKTLEITTDIFNRLYIRRKDDVIWFIYEGQSCKVVSGMIGFTLSDTYGFPVEITKEIFEEKDLDLDVEGFNVIKTLQKEKSQNTFKNTNAF